MKINIRTRSYLVKDPTWSKYHQSIDPLATTFLTIPSWGYVGKIYIKDIIQNSKVHSKNYEKIWHDKPIVRRGPNQYPM